jgi:hypothetical protein
MVSIADTEKYSSAWPCSNFSKWGKKNFSDENMTAAKETIRNNTPENAIMTADYQLQLLDCSFELSQSPLGCASLFEAVHQHPRRRPA